MFIQFLKFILMVSIGLLIGFSLWGISVVSASDATVEFRDTNTYECMNYQIVSNQMFELQSKWIYSKGLKRKVIERKINKLRPLVINREVLCLGYGVTPN